MRFSQRFQQPLGLAVVAFLLAPGLLSAQGALLGEEYVETKSTTIGPGGELFHVQAGMQLDLFPEDPAAGWNSVLALDIVRDGELLERMVIPGTEGHEVESDAALLADGDQVFVLWMSRAEDDLSNLELISYQTESSSFTETVDVSGDPLPLKGTPQLAVTRERIDLPALLDEGGEEIAPAVSSSRTVVHVLWWEEDLSAVPASYYTPIVLADGEFLGWNPVVKLDAAMFGAAPVAGGAAANELLRSASIERGADERSVVIGLPDAESGRLVNLVVRLLPDGLLAIAEEARSHIIGVGLILTGEGPLGGGPDYAGVAEHARSHIIGVGRTGPDRIEIHRGIRDFIAARVADSVLDYGEQAGEAGDVEELANAVWAEALGAGASLLGNQLRSEDLACGVLHLGANGPVAPGSEPTDSRHQVELCKGSEHTLPETSVAGDAAHRIITSAAGDRALIVWEEDGVIQYRRTEVGGWTETQNVPSGLDFDGAVALLRTQIRVR